MTRFPSRSTVYAFTMTLATSDGLTSTVLQQQQTELVGGPVGPAGLRTPIPVGHSRRLASVIAIAHLGAAAGSRRPAELCGQRAGAPATVASSTSARRWASAGQP